MPPFLKKLSRVHEVNVGGKGAGGVGCSRLFTELYCGSPRTLPLATSLTHYCTSSLNDCRVAFLTVYTAVCVSAIPSGGSWG